MKVWSLLKTKEDYEYFHEITHLLFIAKVERFGDQFFKDYTFIMELENSDSVKKYIESLSDSKRQILVGDTYFSILASAS
jgi:hypothetical protein